MADADPPPPLSFPLSTAGGVCPACGARWRFDARPYAGALVAADLRCDCGQLLGRYHAEAGRLWLCVVAAWPASPITVGVASAAVVDPPPKLAYT